MRAQDPLRLFRKWFRDAAAAGIPAGPILDLATAFSDQVAVERDMRVEVDHPVAGRISQVGAPWKLDGFSLRLSSTNIRGISSCGLRFRTLPIRLRSTTSTLLSAGRTLSHREYIVVRSGSYFSQ